jgi:SWI/SNF related-matrix-associated actin-dependent regulator of chromatin subfamily C
MSLSLQDNFGRHSHEPRAMTKLPFALFRDFRPNGSVECILKTVVNFMKEYHWFSFDITGIRSAGLTLLKRLESTLTKARFLRRPIVFLQKVPPNVTQSLTAIVLKHGGFISGSADNATHVIEWDDEVDNLPEDLAEEYVRTLDLRPLENGGVALVHWYYYPDSYDEWISAQDVDAVDPPDIFPVKGNTPPVYHNRVDVLSRQQPWKLCCRFIRDCELFNEWGNEIDYEIIDESDQDSDDANAVDVVSPRTPGRSPGRKAKKGEAKKPTTPKKEAPILESTSYCTDRMMQDVPPPSLDRKRMKIAVVDVPAIITGAASQLSMQSALNSISLETTAKGKVESELPQEPKPADSGDVDPVTGKKRKLPGDSPSSSSSSSSASSSSATATPQGPGWFEPSSISSYEIRYLPGFFSAGYGPQQRESYLQMRAAIIALYQQNPTVYLSATECRRRMAGSYFARLLDAQLSRDVYLWSQCFVGDVCAIIRLHEFLDAFSVINTFVKPENRPPMPSIALLHPPVLGPSVSAPSDGKVAQRNADIDKLLVIKCYGRYCVWGKVSQVLKQKYGLQMTAEDCLNRFVEIPADSLGNFIKTASASGASSSSSSSSAASSSATEKSAIEHKMDVEDDGSSASATAGQAVTSSASSDEKDNSGGASGRSHDSASSPRDAPPENIVSVLRHICSTAPGGASAGDVRGLISHLLHSLPNGSASSSIAHAAEVYTFLT